MHSTVKFPPCFSNSGKDVINKEPIPLQRLYNMYYSLKTLINEEIVVLKPDDSAHQVALTIGLYYYCTGMKLLSRSV